MSTAWDSTTRLWNPQTGRELLRCTDRGVAFSQDARWLGSERPASVGVRRWRVANADVCRTLYGHHSDAYVISLAFDPSGTVLASGSGRDGVRLWDVQQGRELSHLVQEYASGVAFLNEPCRLVTSSVSALQTWPIQLTGAATGATLRCGPATILDTVDPRRVSVGDNALLVGSADTWARLYRDEGVMRIGPLDRGHSENHKFLAISPDGKWAATSGKKAAGVTIWDLDSQAAIRELEVGPARITFSPDGKQLIAGVFQQYIGWDVETWRERWRLSHDGPGYGCVAFTADMRLMATTASHRVILRDGSHRTELATLSAPDPELLSTAHPEGTAALCFSPNGSLLAVGTQGGKIRLWDTSAIRRNLAEIDLDWSDDPLPAAESRSGTAMKIDLIDREKR